MEFTPHQVMFKPCLSFHWVCPCKHWCWEMRLFQSLRIGLRHSGDVFQNMSLWTCGCLGVHYCVRSDSKELDKNKSTGSKNSISLPLFAEHLQHFVRDPACHKVLILARFNVPLELCSERKQSFTHSLVIVFKFGQLKSWKNKTTRTSTLKTLTRSQENNCYVSFKNVKII